MVFLDRGARRSKISSISSPAKSARAGASGFFTWTLPLAGASGEVIGVNMSTIRAVYLGGTSPRDCRYSAHEGVESDVLVKTFL